MRNLLYAALAITLAAVLSTACSDENIGSSLNDTRSSIIVDSSFTITGTTVLNPSLRSRSSFQLLGVIDAPGYGHLESDVVMQFMPSQKLVTDYVTESTIDSCFLVMTLTSGNFTGDSLAPMRMNIYPLDKQLPYPIYSDFDPTSYYSPENLLGSISYSASAVQYGETSSLSRTVSVPMDVAYARELFTMYKLAPEKFSNPTIFAQYMPGLYITNSYGQGHVMNFSKTELQVYYRQVKPDTTINAYTSYLAVSPEVVYNNNIKLEIDESLQQRINNGEAIVVTPAGTEVEIVFPIQEIIDSYKSRTSDGISIINSLELELPVEEIENKYNIAPPKYLLMVKDGMKEDFFEKDSLTNNKDSFYATYNALKKCYTFTGMRDYILNIIKKQDGKATAADINLTITPIDVTTYTNAASYGVAASTIVTKIGPAVSRPGLARLRLDKAKIKITYSKQSMY